MSKCSKFPVVAFLLHMVYSLHNIIIKILQNIINFMPYFFILNKMSIQNIKSKITCHCILPLMYLNNMLVTDRRENEAVMGSRPYHVILKVRQEDRPRNVIDDRASIKYPDIYHCVTHVILLSFNTKD